MALRHTAWQVTSLAGEMSTLRLAASEQDKMDGPCLSDNCYSLFPPLAELGLGSW